ncbi:FxsA cytoplasmic membrane protein [Psychromonas sp. CNPT3]|uniref:FxsA family protein n=1 Tax=Psychromonas sp. CNPT3 TaxID=314282 RepID=UPI00006E711B|nr:FxsA family protein [Psychromonas sp. CNPT3]AGH81934.1 FxsA cytoplasmic membrane protein [Psychromonas sp. CNPT3]
MFARLFVIFSAVSLLEIFVLVKVGSFLGPWPTVALVLVSALVGSALVRSQGLQLIQQLQQRIAQGEMPGQQLIEGGMLLMTGVLLVTPGFVTDFCGLLLLQPNIRASIARVILSTIKLNPASMSTGFSQNKPFKNESLGDGDIIEGEFERKDDDK